jgi:FkbM family methyltransferase
MGLRRIAEMMSRGIVLRRRLPKDLGGGRLYLSPESGLRMWRYNVRRMDPNLLRMASELVKPGATVWDIGANLGLFTFSAAFRAGPTGSVVSVEPDVDNVRLLLRSRLKMDLARNAPVDILPVAIGAPGPRIARFNIALRSRSANTLEGFGGSQMGGVAQVRLVPMMTADDLLDHFKPPDVVKIDVEAAELSLLAGAVRLLRDVRPVILTEVEPINSEGVADVLRANRYRMYDADAETRVEVTRAAWNCLAVPG